MSGLQGLQGLFGTDATIQQPEASAADVQGPSADPRHSDPVINGIYPWQGVPTPGAVQTPYPGFPEVMGDHPDVMPAGTLAQDPRADATPDTHAAPWPSLGLGDSDPSNQAHTAEDLQKLAWMHGSYTGASQEVTYNIPEPQGNWQAYEYVSPGESILATGVPNQLRGSMMGFGSTDRVQSLATQQNGFGFDSAHVSDRRSNVGVPMNRMWLRPGGRPMVIEAHGSTNTFSGQDSPYTGAGLQKQTRTVQGGILQTQASAYVAPPEPVLAPALDPSAAVWPEW